MPLTTSCCPVCERRGCATPADGMLALEVKLARFQIEGSRYLRLTTDRALCSAHLADIDAARELHRVLEDFGDLVEAGSARAVLLPFDHPDVLRVRAAEVAA